MGSRKQAPKCILLQITKSKPSSSNNIDLKRNLAKKLEFLNNSKSQEPIHELIVSPAKSLSSISSASSDDNVVPKRLLEEADKKILSARKKIKSEREKFEEERGTLNNNIESLQEKLLKVEKELSEVKELNLALQFELRNEKIKIASKAVESDSEVIEEKKTYTYFGSKRVSDQELRCIECVSKNSIFVKDLACLIWGKSDLLNRSISGQVCPQFRKDSSQVGKPALTPEKVADVREFYSKRLVKQGFSEVPLKMELQNVNKYIGEKIHDLRRSKRRLSNGVGIEQVLVEAATPGVSDSPVGSSISTP